MEIHEKDKVSILLSLLNERYNASHKMRERSINFAIWVLGFGIASIGFLLNGLNIYRISVYIPIALVIVFTILASYFLYAINRGFEKNREIMCRIEHAIGCYTPGLFVPEETLYSQEYAQKPKDKKRFWQKIQQRLCEHFTSIYALLIFIAFAIIWLLIIYHSNPCYHVKTNNAPINNVEIVLFKEGNK